MGPADHPASPHPAAPQLMHSSTQSLPTAPHGLQRLLPYVLLGMCVVIAGCGQPVADTGELAPAPPLEASWERQLDAVRGNVSARIEISEAVVIEDQFRQLLTECDGLEVLLLDRIDVSPETLSEVLPQLTSLRQLKIGSVIPADAFSHLARLGTLEVLNLPDTRCGDPELALLSALPRLKLLRIHSPALTDAGLQTLPRFPSLRYLHLINTPITDAGLTSVASCEHLESFYLDGGSCTEEGLSTLLKERPELHFHWNDLHLEDDPNTHPHD